jgi:hemerythrin-like domain-containing protein/rubredoxin
MLPIGPLMQEHRLIERMVRKLQSELDRLSKEGTLDPEFILSAVDFFRTYADRTHHGKEEDILFKALEGKEMDDDLRSTMDKLVGEHVYARAMVGRLLESREQYLRGAPGALDQARETLKGLIELYPKHIEKEDKRFFYPCMELFTDSERAEMLEAFWEFDRGMIHWKYQNMVEGTKTRPETPSGWRCGVCGYVYDPVNGDPEYGLAPGVPFEGLGEDWVCPVCYAPKSQFTKV